MLGSQWNLKAISPWLFCLLSAVAAFLVVNYVFCPRLVLWKGLNVPLAWSYPEVNRAVDTLRQIQQPFSPINNPTNDVIRWRLLFPLLAHYLSIPDVVYLAIPHIGCILVLGWFTFLTLNLTKSRVDAFIASVLFGTTSWFFVSSGWLAYFDSWYILGLLLTAFHPSRSLVIASCLLVPWIDERFILALPLSLLVRAAYFDRNVFSSKPFLLDVLAIIATTLPWVAFRAYLVFSAIDTCPSATTNQFTFDKPGVFLTLLDGWWNGLRGLWVYPIVFFVLFIRQRKIVTSALLAAGLIIALVANLRFAGDISRSVSNIIPLVALGFFVSIRSPGFAWRKLLIGLTIFNLFMPASHVVIVFKNPIFYYPYESVHLQQPPPEVSGPFYNTKGIEAWQRQDFNNAFEMFSTAVSLDPQLAEAYLNRGIVSFGLGNAESGEADMRRAIELAPKLYAAQFQLASVLQGKGNKTEAAAMFRSILSSAPATYELRPEIEKRLTELGVP